MSRTRRQSMGRSSKGIILVAGAVQATSVQQADVQRAAEYHAPRQNQLQARDGKIARFVGGPNTRLSASSGRLYIYAISFLALSACRGKDFHLEEGVRCVSVELTSSQAASFSFNSGATLSCQPSKRASGSWQEAHLSTCMA